MRRSIVNASVSGWRKNRHLVVVDDAEPHVRTTTSPTRRRPLDDADEAWALVETLPAQQRAAVVLRFYEDQSFAQIATDPRLRRGHRPLPRPPRRGRTAHAPVRGEPR